MWLVHTWLPDAHAEGADRRLHWCWPHHPEDRRLRLLRFALPILPDALHDWLR